MGTVDGTQSEGYENTGHQAPARLWEHCFPSFPRHLGEEARLPPLTLEPTPSGFLTIQSTRGCLLRGSLGKQGRALHPYPQQQYRPQQQANKTEAVPPRSARAHRHSMVRDAHHSCKGSPARSSMAQVSEANAHKARLTLWWTSGTYMQHSAPTRADNPPWDAVSISEAIWFCKATFLN